MNPRRCHTKYCRNEVTNTRHCSTCRSRKARKADPVRYAYNNLKTHAKARGILFTITLDDFRAFCHRVKYIGFSGRNPDSYTIDRIHNDVGYHIDNIQILKNADNVKKYFSYDYRSRQVFIMQAEAVADENPF